jgi:hypothetical protein
MNARIMLMALLLLPIGAYACTYPSGSPLYYANITLNNTQANATGHYFNQNVTINYTGNSTILSPSLKNLVFAYCNGTLIRSWLENINTTTTGYALYWLNISPGIAGTSKLNITADAYSTSTNKYDGVTVGEAPQLSASYALYDNGANIFPLYDDFSGIASHPNSGLWTSSACSGGYHNISDGISVGDAIGCYGQIQTLSNYAVPGIYSEAYGNETTGDYYMIGGVGAGQNPYAVFSNDPNAGGAFCKFYGGETCSVYAITPYHNYAFSDVYNSTKWDSYLNYSLKGALVASSPNYASGVICGNAGECQFKWYRIRDAPPMNIMPYVKIVGFISTIAPTTSTSTTSTIPYHPVSPLNPPGGLLGLLILALNNIPYFAYAILLLLWGVGAVPTRNTFYGFLISWFGSVGFLTLNAVPLYVVILLAGCCVFSYAYEVAKSDI